MKRRPRHVRPAHARWSWLWWFLGLTVLGPVAWVGVYRYVDPPVTLAMEIESEGEINRTWVPIDRISPSLIDAAIASEDTNFCSHHGFDSTAIREAWRSNQRGKPLRGASTISMQMVKNVFLWPDRTWLRKGLEAYFTALTELVWPKRRIMEVYLNVAQWGDGLYGAQAAARRYFRTDAANLSPGEAARLVAVLPNPRNWSPLSNGPPVFSRAVAIEQRSELIRADGKARCVGAGD